MKAKIFLFLLLIYCSPEALCQAEYNNWYFGENAGVSFNTVPPTALTNNSIGSYGGLGTLSDKVTGEFLFHTNGKNIWDRNFSIMPNTTTGAGILNGAAFEEGTLIVPSLTNKNQYYVFTLGYVTGKLFYSLVDLSLNGGLGDVVSGQKNIILTRPNGTQFTLDTYAITVTTNDTGNAYWVLFPNNNVLYAYKIDASGLNTTAVTTNLNFTNNQASANNYLTCIKVSPDKQKVGISFCDQSMAYQAGNQSKIYHFNSATGTIDTSLEITINNRSIRDLEFSPDSNLVFLNSSNWTYPNNKVFVYDFNNLATSPRTIDLPNTTYLHQLQRAVTGEIYSANVYDPYYMIKFHNSNDYNTTIDYRYIDLLSGVTQRRSTNTFPQLTPQLGCALFEDLRGNNVSVTTNYSYQVSDRITTSNNYIVNTNQNINFFANNYIEFKGNTLLSNGSSVLARIQPCPTPGSKTISGNSTHNESIGTIGKEFLIIPNPATDVVVIKTNQFSFDKITITTLDGKVVRSASIGDTSEYSLDVSNMAEGVYLISVTSKEGNPYTQKLVKN